VYGDRDNPTVLTIQPLVDFFDAVERGERDLPSPESRPCVGSAQRKVS
jgi:hypothetical protein